MSDLENWDLVSFALSSQTRRRILSALREKPQTPRDLSVAIDRGPSQVSRALGELTSKGLVACLTPTRRRYKFFTLTEKGLDLASTLQSLQPDEERKRAGTSDGDRGE
ncbi:MAG: ArsR/SmtB family transcription factor [Candidatus Thorarchaeota archaeon]